MKQLFTFFVFLSSLTACMGDGVSPALDVDARGYWTACESIGGTYSGVSFTDEEASNAVDFLDQADLAELELVKGIGPALSADIAAMRPLITFDDPLAELDAHPLIGERILTSLRDLIAVQWCRLGDGRQSCCIDLGCDDLGAWVSGVPFTDEQAFVTLEWANGASLEQLEAVCGIGPAIADEIIHARPLHSLHDLDRVSWIGPSTLERLIGRGDGACEDQSDVLTVWCDFQGACACEY